MNAKVVSMPVAGLECPLCHTAAPALTDATLLAGGDWRCARCHQIWTAQRLATVTGYADYCAALAALAAAVSRPAA